MLCLGLIVLYLECNRHMVLVIVHMHRVSSSSLDRAEVGSAAGFGAGAPPGRVVSVPVSRRD